MWDAETGREVLKLPGEFVYLVAWSPDGTRLATDSISNVGSMLDVDVSDLCGNLESKASQWEDDLPVSEEDRGGDDDDERWGHSEFTSDDTSAMFEELLDELDESGSWLEVSL